jgi:hypothetical protein
MAQHLPEQQAGKLPSQEVGPLHQRTDDVLAGPPEPGQLRRHRVVRGGGHQGLQVGEQLASARPERLSSDHPGQPW